MNDNTRGIHPGIADSLHSRNPMVADPSEDLSNHDFRRLCRLIYEHSGIRIKSPKRILLEGRIRSRFRLLGMNGYHEYCECLFSAQGISEELIPMIDSVTTNKTDFFREPWHFEFLQRQAMPFLQKLYGAHRTFHAWSAACSSGEEPFTLAMVLSDIAECTPGFQYRILATDISTKVLDIAQKGIYPETRIEPVPMAMRRKYLLRSRDRQIALVKIAPELRDKVAFRRLNLTDDQYGIECPLDAIFCRNVLIYFDRPTQERTVEKLCRHLAPGGYLFMGHAEVLANMPVDVKNVATSTYQKPWKGRA
jgi:chemotaxis protein methyltransferase CheR